MRLKDEGDLEGARAAYIELVQFRDEYNALDAELAPLDERSP